jgi:cell envelope opacity-associated protein A
LLTLIQFTDAAKKPMTRTAGLMNMHNVLPRLFDQPKRIEKMHSTRLTRRNLLQHTRNIVAASALAPLFAGRAAAAVTPITVGFIYAATRQDYG